MGSLGRCPSLGSAPDSRHCPHRTAALRLLEQKLVQRGRIDVLFVDGVWEITSEDPEYVRNEIFRAAHHKHAGVVELDRLDLPSTTLCDVGIGVSRLFMLGDLDIQLPVPCEICTELIEGAGSLLPHVHARGPRLHLLRPPVQARGRRGTAL